MEIDYNHVMKQIEQRLSNEWNKFCAVIIKRLHDTEFIGDDGFMVTKDDFDEIKPSKLKVNFHKGYFTLSYKDE